MNITRELLEQTAQTPLPGLEAQLALAPKMRRELMRQALAAGISPRQSAVLLLLHKVEEQWCIALIQRNSYPGVHADQIGFPGGRWETTDPDYWHTAQRETLEEIGIAPSEYDLVQALTPLYIPPSNFMMHPFVAIAREPLHFTLDPREVVQVFSYPVTKLLAPDAIIEVPKNTSYQAFGTVPAFQWEEVEVWGATAMVLSEWRALILASLHP